MLSLTIALSSLVLVAALCIVSFDLSAVFASLSEIFDRKTYEWFVDDCILPDSTPTDVGSGTDRIYDGLDVVYAASTASYPGLLSSMLSLSRNLEFPGQTTIHIIVPEADRFDVARLIDCFNREVGGLATMPSVNLHTMRAQSALPFNLTKFAEWWLYTNVADDYMGLRGISKLTPLEFALLYVPEYVPNASRAIWLSPDTIVRADVSQLLRVPMNSSVAAARDIKSTTWRSQHEAVLGDLEVSHLLKDVPSMGARLLNTGVLVLDLKRWRTDSITQKLETWVTRAYGVGQAELAMNLEFKEDFDVLDWRWHAYVVPVPNPLPQCIDGARIIHWLGPIYPWSENLTSQQKALYSNLTGPSEFLQRCSWNVSSAMLDSDIDI